MCQEGDIFSCLGFLVCCYTHGDMKKNVLPFAILPLLFSCAAPETSSVSSTSSSNESSVSSSSKEHASDASSDDSSSSAERSSSQESPSSEGSVTSSSMESDVSSSIPSSSEEDSSDLSSSSDDSSSDIVSSSEDASISSDSSSEETSQQKEDIDPYREPCFGRQYYLNHIGDIFSAWESYTGKGVGIAVIDLGFNPYHEDFYYANGQSKVRADSACFTTSGSTTTSSVGVEYVENMGESHGTFCAGVAAAAVNGKGVAGIAPEAELLLLKTDAKPKSIVEAFRYAADSGVKVVTISIGSYSDYGGDLQSDGSDLTTVFDDAVAYCREKGVVVCSAAGNGGLEGRAEEYTYPASTAGVLGVGGLKANSSTEVWEGSSYNYDANHVFADVFAPADAIFGCCHYGGKLYDEGWNGTSFASPIVAGAAALYFEKNPNATVVQFEQDLYASCVPLTNSSLGQEKLGHGRLDIGSLLSTRATGNCTISVRDSVATLYAYVWNSITQEKPALWPGVMMNKVGGTFSTNVDFDHYDSLVIAESSSGPQTVDLCASSLYYGGIYDLRAGVFENDANAYSGQFSA